MEKSCFLDLKKFIYSAILGKDCLVLLDFKLEHQRLLNQVKQMEKLFTEKKWMIKIQ